MIKEDIVNKFSKNLEEYYQIEINSPMNESLTEMLRTAIDEANPVENRVMPKIAEVKRSKTLGTWESIRERFICPKCETEEILDSHSYCPNCGIKINFVD